MTALTSPLELRYLYFPWDLKDHILSKLGSMKENSFESCVKRMQSIAEMAGVAQSELAIQFTFNDKVKTFPASRCYLINVADIHLWELFQKCEHLYVNSPEVFVVDAAKIGAPCQIEF